MYLNPQRCPARQLLLGISAVPEEAMEEIMQRLARAWGIGKR